VKLERIFEKKRHFNSNPVVDFNFVTSICHTTQTTFSCEYCQLRAR